jgi:hypothetical protein
VKYYVLALAASTALAQSVTNTYATDLNGRRVETATTVATNGQRTEVTQNINGRRIPLEQTDEKVVRQDGTSKVIEKTVRKYDRSGQLVSTARQVIEEQTRPNGSTTHTTTYRSDVNGRMAEAERETTETQQQGSVTRMQSVVERPTVNGSFQAVEKREAVTQTSPTGSQQDQTFYQRSDNGGYVVTARQVKETTQSGNRTTETTAMYQPLATNSQLQLTQQNVATITKRPDGSETVQTNYYGSSWNGQLRDNQSGPQLRGQDVVERAPGPGGSVIETLSTRRPSASDVNKLGPLMKVSETICTGKCARDQ